MLLCFSSISREMKTELTMAAMCSQYLRPRLQKCSCEKIPDAKYLFLHSSSVDLNAKMETKHCASLKKLNL